MQGGRLGPFGKAWRTGHPCHRRQAPVRLGRALAAARAPGEAGYGEGLGREHTSVMALQWPIQPEFLGTPREGLPLGSLGWRTELGAIRKQWSSRGPPGPTPVTASAVPPKRDTQDSQVCPSCLMTNHHGSDYLVITEMSRCLAMTFHRLILHLVLPILAKLLCWLCWEDKLNHWEAVPIVLTGRSKWSGFCNPTGIHQRAHWRRQERGVPSPPVCGFS